MLRSLWDWTSLRETSSASEPRGVNARLPQFTAGLGLNYAGEPRFGFIVETSRALCASGLSRRAYKSDELSDVPLRLDLNVLKSSKGQDSGDCAHG
jgi:hypothetical protein